MAGRHLGKVRSLPELREACGKLRSLGKRIVHCHGVFDLLHLGHMRHLNSAKQYGDVLVVTLTADTHVKRGPGRPIFNQDLRAEALANLEIVDYVGVIDEPSALAGIRAIRPHFYVKGPDYKGRKKDGSQKLHSEELAVRKNGGKIVMTDDPTFSSSQLINLYLDSFPEETAKYLKSLGRNYSIDDIKEILDKVRKLKVLVIGDTIIDQYHYCLPLGKSSKESIVAHKNLTGEDFAGGTLATANHTAQIVDQVDLMTVIGSKNSFEKFIRGKLDPNIRPHLFVRPGTCTTVKRRYVSEGSKKAFEICFMDDHDLSHEEEAPIVAHLERVLPRYDLVIVSDFGHGMMTPRVVRTLCKKAKRLAINVQTNSANIGFNLVTKYPRADLVCIDQLELRLATGKRLGELGELVRRVHRQLRCKTVIATRGREGSMSYSSKGGEERTPSFAQRGVDAVGAGDAFFAYVSPCFAVGAPLPLLGFVGNAVGALKIQIVGNKEPVRKGDVVKFMTRLLKV